MNKKLKYTPTAKRFDKQEVGVFISARNSLRQAVIDTLQSDACRLLLLFLMNA